MHGVMNGGNWVWMSFVMVLVIAAFFVAVYLVVGGKRGSS
jgi:ABC-type multidrug transport system permease subunit